MFKFRLAGILTIFLTLLAVITLLAQPIVAQNGVTVSIDAPAEVVANTDFTATINIAGVTDIDATNFDVVFDPTVLRLDNVTDGSIGGVAIPVDFFNSLDSTMGNYRVVQNILGFSGTSGSGSLAVLHFHVIGLAGQSSTISLSNDTLSNITANRITADWTGSTVTVRSADIAPSITQQPVGQTVTEGETATFTAAASGSPAPTVQWEVSTNGGIDWAEIPGATSTDYSFTAALADDGNQYRAIFTNSVSSVTTDAATLTVTAIQETASVDISVTLQGGSRPPEGWVVPLSVKFFTPGSNVLTDTPIYTFNLETVQSGTAATVRCTNVLPGTYDISAVSEHTLVNVKLGVAVTAPEVSISLGELLEGNADNNGIIDILDFGLLAEAYGTVKDAPGYNPMTDFDRNGKMDILDFGLLSVNYNLTSPVEVP